MNTQLINVLDFKMHVFNDDPGISARLKKRGKWEPLAVEILTPLLKPGMNVIEIGANIGYYTLLTSGYIRPCGHIYAIEPVPENVDLLKKNIAENGIGDMVSVYTQGIGEDGEGELMLMEESNRGTMTHQSVEYTEKYLKKADSKTRKTIRCKTHKLDTFVKTNNINRIDHIRMDIEGYEMKVVADIRETFRRMPKDATVFIELHNHKIKGIDEQLPGFIEKFTTNGFEVHAALTKKKNQPVHTGTRGVVNFILSRDRAVHIFFKKVS